MELFKQTWKIDSHATESSIFASTVITVRNMDTDNSDIVCEVLLTGDDEYDREVVWSYAHLIAASPLLLRAVLQVFEAAEHGGSMESIDWDLLREAVNKSGYTEKETNS